MQASERMRRIRQRGTAPELAVRRELFRAGVRFRVCCSSLPGTPDIANASGRWAVFVHGCFWHGHRNCGLWTIPKTNRRFWREKFEANRRRDARKVRQLRALGYRVYVIWQCQTKRPSVLHRLAVKLQTGGARLRADERQ